MTRTRTPKPKPVLRLWCNPCLAYTEFRFSHETAGLITYERVYHCTRCHHTHTMACSRI